MEQNIEIFLDKLSSKSPTPGGGGVAALCGAMGASLAGMVCNLTIGKPRYKQYEEDVMAIVTEAKDLQDKLFLLAEKDEIAFEPLSKAYSLPNETEEEKKYKADVMEECLLTAAKVPLAVIETAYEALLLHEKLVERGSKLAISDVAVGAIMCKSAMQSAALNVYINTKYLQNKKTAEEYNSKTDEYLKKGTEIADKVYEAVFGMLK